MIVSRDDVIKDIRINQICDRISFYEADRQYMLMLLSHATGSELPSFIKLESLDFVVSCYRLVSGGVVSIENNGLCFLHQNNYSNIMKHASDIAVCGHKIK